MLDSIVNPDCGTPTAVIDFFGTAGGYTGTYNQISATYWEQVAPSPDYAIRLVGGIWEIFQPSDPGAGVSYSIPETQFPCGEWTTINGVAPAFAGYA